MTCLELVPVSALMSFRLDLACLDENNCCLIQVARVCGDQFMVSIQSNGMIMHKYNIIVLEYDTDNKYKYHRVGYRMLR